MPIPCFTQTDVDLGKRGLQIDVPGRPRVGDIERRSSVDVVPRFSVAFNGPRETRLTLARRSA